MMEDKNVCSNAATAVVSVSQSGGQTRTKQQSASSVSAGAVEETHVEVGRNDDNDTKCRTQPAGESSTNECVTNNGRGEDSQSTKPRSTTITSYEELEDQLLKDNTNGGRLNIPAPDANGEAAQFTSSMSKGPHLKSLVSKPAALLVTTTANAASNVSTAHKESNFSASEDCQGPPKVITTTSTSGRSNPLGTTASLSSNKAKQAASLRRGKWTAEEEAYVARVIQDFNSGFLDAPAGTTLRTYLSEKLQCDPMRITKKFTGDACIGKRVFHPAVRSPSNGAAIDKAQMELENLERRWRRRLEMQQRESAKKVPGLASGSRGPGIDQSGNGAVGSEGGVVSRTASWLDRAKSVLKEPSDGRGHHGQTEDLRSQMQEVERLINEGPTIRQSSAVLPEMIEKDDDDYDGDPDNGNNTTSDKEPADKRLRTAEDAEALVGFLRSVRASAAAGQNF